MINRKLSNKIKMRKLKNFYKNQKGVKRMRF